jgi:hypothetical protein
MPQSPFTLPLLAVYLQTGSAVAVVAAFGVELMLALSGLGRDE